MSQYENYDKISLSYDRTRKAVGLEVILGFLKAFPKSLEEITVLDAGCGTGNYAYELKPQLKKIVCADFSSGMLKKASEKLNTLSTGSHEIIQCDMTKELPFESNSFDVIMCNQSLHHLDSPEDNFLNQQQFFKQVQNILKPDGKLIISTITHEQLREGVWWGELIKPAVERMMTRFPSLEVLNQLLDNAGMHITHRVVPLNVIIQEQGYFDPNSLKNEVFRNGDSHFSLLSADELDHALQQLEDLEKHELIQDYIYQRDKLRKQHGQVTFFLIQKREVL